MGVCFNKSEVTVQSKLKTQDTQQKQVKTTNITNNPASSLNGSHRNSPVSKSPQPRHTSHKIVKKPELGSINSIETICIQEGQPSTRIQNGFEEKIFSCEQSELDTFLNQGIIAVCKKGLKPESPNQDDYSILLSKGVMICGVFDGHGPFGHDVSDFVHKSLPRDLIQSEDFDTNTQEALKTAFLKVNKTLVEQCEEQKVQYDCTISGTTATVGVITLGKITIGHVGDSRAVLIKQTDQGLKAQRITDDHKPHHPAEMERITQNNGEVKRIPGDIPYRVFVKGKEFPGLAMSRAIGDKIAQTIGVIPEAEVSVIDLEQEDLYLVICSDGVWEFIEDQEVADMIQKAGNIGTAAQNLASLSWAKWLENEEDVVDDITIIMVDLNSAK